MTSCRVMSINIVNGVLCPHTLRVTVNIFSLDVIILWGEVDIIR